ncbi:ABC-2 transporter permease [Haloterrigena salina]|uniref:ABC-2 transporter permease n=1 Tax=Haloterrigena salina TaxID=504937 RepID=UPI000A010F36
MRRLYHIARADFLQRVRSRRLLVVLAVVAYLGFLVNVGQIELAYQVTDRSVETNFHGENTAAFIGLKAGLTGSAVILFGGFYLMKNTLERDRLYDVDQLVVSTPISDKTYLAGKWLSNIALGAVILLTLGFATIANHAIHGIGPTNPVSLLAPLFVFAFPVCVLVGAVSLLFETVDRLNGTLGNISYIILATFSLAALAATQNSLPGSIPPWVKAGDILGHISIYNLTVDSLLVEVPNYSGGVPSIGTLDGDQTFRYDGGSWPLWIYFQRIGIMVFATFVVLAATVLFDRTPSYELSNSSKRLSWVAAVLSTVTRGNNVDEDDTNPQSIDSISLTPVNDRDSGGFGRLLAAEIRLALRGQPWWWYIGAVALIGSPLLILANESSPDAAVMPIRQIALPLAFIWPIFIWSGMGVRTVKHRMTSLVLSSKYANKQLIAEWLAGVVIAMGIGSGILVLFVSAGQPELFLGYAGGVLFAPSLAIATGIWSRSSWLFEIVYLMIWYVGPLNSAVPLDFVGSTTESIEIGIPLVFIGVSLVLFSTAALRRRMETQ